MKNNTEFAKSTLLGLACGDALGTTVEFRRRDTFPLHTEMTGNGAFNVKPGEWTDDTSMALCLAQSLVQCQGFDSKTSLNAIFVGRMKGICRATAAALILAVPLATP